MENLQIHMISSPGTRPNLIQIEGSLCGLEAIRFKNQLLAYIDQKQNELTIDLSEIEKIDFSGINTLAMAYRKMQRLGYPMQIIAPLNGSMNELMSLTKFDRFLPIQH